MRKDSGRKILFVINPSAGTYPKGGYGNDISRAAEKYNFKWSVYETTGKSDLEEIGRYITEFKPDTVVSVGGDGTVNMVARVLLGSTINLGIIPAGSANGLAYNLDIPEGFNDAIKIILNSTAKPLDVININDEYFCLHLSDIGINARIVKRFDKEGSKGMIGYGKQLFKELFAGKTYFSFYLQVPHKPRMKYNAEMLVIANANSFGTGVIINPAGKYNDSRFEIVVIRPYPWWFIFVLIFASFTGKLHKMKRVMYYRSHRRNIKNDEFHHMQKKINNHNVMKYIRIFSVPEAIITLTEPKEFQVDGEIIPDISSLKIKIMPQAINVLGA